MNKGIFSERGHKEPWQSGFCPNEQEKKIEYMKGCNTCRQYVIEATLLWAALRPRATAKQIIKSITDSYSSIESNVLPFNKYLDYLLQRILQYTKG